MFIRTLGSLSNFHGILRNLKKADQMHVFMEQSALNNTEFMHTFEKNILEC